MVMGGDVCSVTKQVGGTATVFVCARARVCLYVIVCIWLHTHVCMEMHVWHRGMLRRHPNELTEHLAQLLVSLIVSNRAAVSVDNMVA